MKYESKLRESKPAKTPPPPPVGALPGLGAFGPDGEAPWLLTVDDVARLLSISVRSVWRLVSRAELPQPLSLGGSKRWHRDAVAQAVAAKLPSTRG